MITAEYAQSVGLTPEIFRAKFHELHLNSSWIDPPNAKPPHRRGMRDLSHIEREQVGNLYIEGMRVRDIARRWQLNESTIYRILDSLGVPRSQVSRKDYFQI